MVEHKVLLSLLAHPDDAEFLCGGTMALLHQKGWEIHIASMTPGDCGSIEHSRQEISNIRRAEGAKSAELLDGKFHCCECEDLFITYDKPTLLKAIETSPRYAKLETVSSFQTMIYRDWMVEKNTFYLAGIYHPIIEWHR